MKVRELLKDKHIHSVRTIDMTADLEMAIEQMTADRASALIVLDGDLPVGILAERDVLRVHLKNRDRAFTDIPVREAMTNKLIVAEPEDEARDAMAMMIKAEIRHLPVIQDRTIVGMLTMNELVKHQIGNLEAELHYLNEYIADLQEAVQD